MRKDRTAATFGLGAVLYRLLVRHLPRGAAGGPASLLLLFGVWLVLRNAAYLAFTGTTPPSGWAYCRVWQVTSPSANLKQIRVTVRMFQSGLLRPLPQSTLVTLKSSPF